MNEGGRRLARLVLWAERLAPGLAALASLLSAALALALFDLAPLLPLWLHLALLAGLAVGIGFCLFRLFQIPQPTALEAERRLDDESGLAERPLAALSDSLADGDSELWAAHQARMGKLAETLTPGWPRPVLAARDPWGLRFAALLALVLAVAGSGSERGARLARFLIPELPADWRGSALVWVEPPAATGLAPFSPKGEVVTVPAGSRIKASLSGGWGTGKLVAGDASVAFANGQAEAVVMSGDRLAVVQMWREVAGWSIRTEKDQPPHAAFAGTLEPAPRGRLGGAVEASDDYGLARLWLAVLPLDAPPETKPLTLPLILADSLPKSARVPARIDLAAHDWAGREVLITPWAMDGGGQAASGPAIQVVLPQREFRHPLARQLVGWRKELADAPRLAPEIAQRLRGLLEDGAGLDARVFLALTLARLDLMAAESDLAEPRDLLWAAAIRLEDGEMSEAEAAMEQARSELERALADKASPERLAELLDRFEAAVERLIAAAQAAGLDAPPPGEAAQASEDLDAALDQLRGLAETGDRDALRERLNELTDALSRLTQAAPPGPQDARAAKAMAQLRELARRQQELLEQSFRNTPQDDDDESDLDQPAKPSASDRAQARKSAQAQEALKRALRDLERDMGQAPAELGQSGQFMDEAAASLGRADWATAAEAQAEALRLLRDGAKRMAETGGKGGGKSGGVGLAPRDPFGRPGPGQPAQSDGKTVIPGQGELGRARQILDELRRRAGEPQRPEAERDYLRRLMKPF